MLGKVLFQVAKSPFMGKTVGFAFQYLSWALPVRMVYHSKEIIAFGHPKPSYANHLILSPKCAVPNLLHMSSGGLYTYFRSIWKAAQAIGTTQTEYREGFTLVANGGRKQEVQQVHFHMFSGHRMVEMCVAEQSEENVVFQDQHLVIVNKPESDWELHFVARSAAPLQNRENEKAIADYFSKLLKGIGYLEDRFGIVAKGYSLVYQCHMQEEKPEFPVFHVIAGKRRTVQPKE